MFYRALPIVALLAAGGPAFGQSYLESGAPEPSGVDFRACDRQEGLAERMRCTDAANDGPLYSAIPADPIAERSLGDPERIDGRLIAEFTSDGTQAPEPFTAAGDWAIEWMTEGPATVTVFDAQGNAVDRIQMDGANSSGFRRIAGSGSYSLQVEGGGNWIMRVRPVG